MSQEVLVMLTTTILFQAELTTTNSINTVVWAESENQPFVLANCRGHGSHIFKHFEDRMLSGGAREHYASESNWKLP